MKTKFYYVLISLLMTVICVSAQNTTIRGNGKIIKSVIEIDEYDKVKLSGGFIFEYTQSDAKSHLEVEVDENILPFVSVEIQNRTLIIKLKEGPFRSMPTLHPTQFRFISNSKALKDAVITGGIQFDLSGTLRSDDLRITMTGGGKVNLPMVISKNIDISITGGARLIADLAIQDELNCQVTGGGCALLSGSADEGSFKVTGGGRVEASSCKIKSASCQLTGGGYLEIDVTDELDAQVTGGGRIRYAGNPRINQKTTGGGSIKPL